MEPARGPSALQRAASAASWSARACFAAVIILIPVRYRIVLAARPIQRIPSGYTDLVLSAADIGVLVMLTLWGLSWMLAPRRLTAGPRTIWIPLAGLTLAGWASTISSLDPLLSVYHAIRFVALYWFYLYIINEMREARWVLIPAGIQVVSEAVIALGQFVTQRSTGLQALGEPSLDPAQPGMSVVAADGLRLLRSHGLTIHPNILGGCLVFGSLLMLAAYLHSSKPAVLLPAILVGEAAVLTTFSRSAWLALALGTAVLLAADVFSRRAAWKRWAWLGATSLAVALPLLFGYARFFGVRLNAGNSFTTPSMEQQSIGERKLLIKSALAMIADRPWTGMGLGAAPEALKIYRPSWKLSFEPPHMALLDAAAETGLPGAAIYLTLTLAPFVIYLRRSSRLAGDPALTATIALLLGIAVVGLLDYYTWNLPPGQLWQWLAWGLWAVAISRQMPPVSSAE